MFRMLIDTCVWLDLARDPRQSPSLGVLDEMVRRRVLTLIVPRVVLNEFRKHRERIARESAKSLSAQFRLVKDAVGRVGGDKRKARAVLSYLDDVNHKIPIVGGSAVAALEHVEKLLTAPPILEPSEAVRLRAAQRAIEGTAPFHHGKNAMADAIILETYAECVRAKSSAGVRFAFVTHNKADFSAHQGNQKLPHPDFVGVFSRIRSLYFISLPEALHRVEPSLVSELMFEHPWTQEPRGLAEIMKAEDLLFNQVWYNRHQNMRAHIRSGEIKIVEKETYPRSPGRETITPGILKMAIKAAHRVERRYGKKNLGPWDDFEWGMINGKLSALRWALGDEWDMLDT